MKQYKQTSLNATYQTTYAIEALYGAAYDTAIEKTVKYVNKTHKAKSDL